MERCFTCKHKSANDSNIAVSYRLVNDEVRGLLALNEPIWSQKMVIFKGAVKF